MLERYFIRPDTVDRIRSSWIGQAVERYVTWLAERRYSCRSVVRRVPILVRFGEFARDRGATKWDELPNHLEPFVERWLSEHARGRKSKDQRKKIGQCVHNPIRQMLLLAVPGYVGLGRPHKPENPFEDSAPRFFEYLRDEKGLRERSILHYKHYLRQFAAHLQRIGLRDVRHLSPMKGAIERWNRTWREEVEEELPEEPLPIEELQSRIWGWLAAEYNSRARGRVVEDPHSSEADLTPRASAV